MVDTTVGVSQLELLHLIKVVVLLAVQARSMSLMQASPPVEGLEHSPDFSIGVTYTMSVGVGQPATDYTLLIDTGI
jgi:hypothetical protein